jgi:serine/tyrosine/threonine adenylyltransferase
MNTVFNLKKLEALEIDSAFINALPGDPISENYTRQVSGACYSHVTPDSFPDASLIAYSREMAEELGLDPDDCKKPLFTKVFSGTELLDSMRPYSCCYGGHQFGNWAGQLGDGRAINLGELLAPDEKTWTLQLKGAGPTPYSRSADGLAVLRSSVREFLCSEAMYHLGVPTTRALSLIGTGESVVRDMFYDGHPKKEPGAVVCRVAPSFIRFGSFEIFAARKEQGIQKELADYTIRRNFPHLLNPNKSTPDKTVYLAWFREVCQLTATMIIHWMRVGFVHGVMNTDNMSVLGLTIDYGPYGWLENYDPEWTPNTTDAEGRRYRFGNQPMIALWNLVQFANAIYPLVEAVEPLEEVLEEYKTSYEKGWLDMMGSKLGLTDISAEDEVLVLDLIKAFNLAETDMTLFFRHLADVPAHTDSAAAFKIISPAFYDSEHSDKVKDGFSLWLTRYGERLQQENSDDEQRKAAMNQINPLYVLRNYLAQLAIDKSEQGDHSAVNELLDVLRTPYDHQEGKDHLAAKRPEWARTKAGCSMLSCSS